MIHKCLTCLLQVILLVSMLTLAEARAPGSLVKNITNELLTILREIKTSSLETTNVTSPLSKASMHLISTLPALHASPSDYPDSN